jgi:predicted 3-demethylubiquinone-9 3-methyltransferase (glyoxalase superfamily)
MERIIPNLWYDKEAKEAVQFYVSIFDNARILDVTVIEDTPSGDAEMLSFQLEGQLFSALSGGPIFKLNPSISLMVACSTADEVDKKHALLSQGGFDLMPLGEYPFSKRYAWTQDRYGLSWQLILSDEVNISQKITPSLLFSNEACGKTEEALSFYVNIFKGGTVNLVSHYAQGEASLPEAKINYANFTIHGMNFSAMDNGYPADFNFNEAFSLMIICDRQEQIDYYWNALSAVPEAEQCGWLKDKFGVSWQVAPQILDDIMYHGTREEARRVTQAFLPMKKIDIKAIEAAVVAAKRGD